MVGKGGGAIGDLRYFNWNKNKFVTRFKKKGIYFTLTEQNFNLILIFKEE